MFYVLQEFLKNGFVVQLISKLCGKSLRVLENGALDCGGDTGTACKSHSNITKIIIWLSFKFVEYLQCAHTYRT